MGEGERVERRLVAILAADVVGYSRLIGLDETGTLAALRALRKNIVDPKIEKHQGRIVKLMGDGVLVEFPSVVEATQCAVGVQRAMVAHNTCESGDRQIEFRVGINVGDIIVEGEDILGDGVNIAARMEGLAEPGGICISRAAFSQVRDKLPLVFEDMGEIAVKNIARPVQVYRVLLEKVTEPRLARAIRPHRRSTAKRLVAAASVASILAIGGALWWQPWAPRPTPALPLPDKPSIAVLRFDNLSADPEQAHFALGTTESITTDLAGINGLFVISRMAATAFEPGTDLMEIGRQLGVRYVLEGSVQRGGDQLRINAQLIDAQTGGHVWAERYDGSLGDLLGVQDKIARAVVSALAVKLTPEEEERVDAPETANMEAYDRMVHAIEHYRFQTPEDTKIAIAELEKAIELDPDYGRAHTLLARIMWDINNTNWHAVTEYQWANAFEVMKTSLAKAKRQPISEAYALAAEILVYQGRHREALEDIERAIDLDSSSAEAVLAKATIMNVTGRAEEAEEIIRYAMRLNPRYGPNYNRILARALFHQKRYAEAAEMLEAVVAREPHEHDFVTLASAYGHLGRIDEARAHVENYNATMGEWGYNALAVQEIELWWYGDMYFYDKTYHADLTEGLRKTGVPEGAGTDIPVKQFTEMVTRTDSLSAVRGVAEIDAQTAKIYSERGVLIVDVRDDGSYARGHIPGSINLELTTELDEQALLEHIGKDDEVIFHCHNQYCPYSAYAAAKAVLWEFKRVYRFAAGFPEWEAAGYPVKTEPGS